MASGHWVILKRLNTGYAEWGLKEGALGYVSGIQWNVTKLWVSFYGENLWDAIYGGYTDEVLVKVDKADLEILSRDAVEYGQYSDQIKKLEAESEIPWRESGGWVILKRLRAEYAEKGVKNGALGTLVSYEHNQNHFKVMFYGDKCQNAEGDSVTSVTKLEVFDEDVEKIFPDSPAARPYTERIRELEHEFENWRINRYEWVKLTRLRPEYALEGVKEGAIGIVKEGCYDGTFASVLFLGDMTRDEDGAFFTEFKKLDVKSADLKIISPESCPGSVAEKVIRSDEEFKHSGIEEYDWVKVLRTRADYAEKGVKKGDFGYVSFALPEDPTAHMIIFGERRLDPGKGWVRDDLFVNIYKEDLKKVPRDPDRTDPDTEEALRIEERVRNMGPVKEDRVEVIRLRPEYSEHNVKIGSRGMIEFTSDRYATAWVVINAERHYDEALGKYYWDDYDDLDIYLDDLRKIDFFAE